MKQRAYVEKRIDDQFVLVRVFRNSSCGQNCSHCGLCAKQEVTAVVKDPLGVNPGEWVIVESGSIQILTLSALLYLFPLLTFFAFYLIATLFWTEDLPLALMGCLGFFAGLAVPFFLSKKLRGKIQMSVFSRESVEGKQ